MKLLLALFLVFAGFTARAQAWQSPLPYDSTTHKISYNGIVQTPGTAAELQGRARAWYTAKFTDAQTPLSLTTAEDGRLIGKGFTRVTWGDGIGQRSRRVWFVFTLEAKEGRYRYEFTGLENQNDQNPDLARAAGMSNEQLTTRSPVENVYVPGNKYNFTKKGQPIEALRQYTTALHTQMQSLVQSLQQAEANAGKTNW